MYWPIETPRIYATSASCPPSYPHLYSYDGLPAPDQRPTRASLLSPGPAADGHDASSVPPTPITPVAPFTPAIKSVEHDYYDDGQSEPPSPPPPEPSRSNAPPREPILALRVARAGHLFAVITSTSMTIWQTKVDSQHASLLPPLGFLPCLLIC